MKKDVLTIREYLRPQTLEEAYTLCQKKSNVVLGGMLWLRMQNSQVGAAIDLCDLGLDTIEETPEAYSIGAMVTLRQLEQHPGLASLTQDAMAEAVKHIVGVQFRNLATVGGSLYGRFGFSDVSGAGRPGRVVPRRGDASGPVRGAAPAAAGYPSAGASAPIAPSGGLSEPAEHCYRFPGADLRGLPRSGGDLLRHRRPAYAGHGPGR